MIRLTSLMLVCLLVAVLVAVGCAPTKAPTLKAEVPAGFEMIRIYGGPLGSWSATTALSLAAFFTKFYPEISWSSCSGTGGTNVIYVTKGTAKAAMLQASQYITAYGSDKVLQSRIRSLNCPTELAHYVLLIPEDKPWKNLSEVPRGLTLCPGTPGGTMPLNTELWLELAGLSKNDFKWVPMGAAELADAWRAGKVDIAMANLTGAAPAYIDMYISRKFKPMGLSPEQVAKAKAEGTFARYGWEGPAMGNLSKLAPEIFKYDVYGPMNANFFACRDDLPDEVGYKIAKLIYEHRAELVELYAPIKHGATPEHHIKWAQPPLDIHAGVAKYYKEKGYLK